MGNAKKRTPRVYVSPRVGTGLVKMRAEFIVRGTKVFRDYAGLSDDGDKIGIALPSRHHVQMQVPRDTGAGALSNVETDIESVRTINLGESHLTLASGQNDFFQLIVCGFGKGRDVTSDHHHEVARRVGVPIEDQKAVGLTQENEVFFVLILLLKGAENTSARLVAGRDVLITPRGPQAIHLRIDQFLKFLTRLKVRNPLGRHVDSFSGLRIAAVA